MIEILNVLWYVLFGKNCVFEPIVNKPFLKELRKRRKAFFKAMKREGYTWDIYLYGYKLYYHHKVILSKNVPFNTVGYTYTQQESSRNRYKLEIIKGILSHRKRNTFQENQELRLF